MLRKKSTGFGGFYLCSECQCTHTNGHICPKEKPASPIPEADTKPETETPFAKLKRIAFEALNKQMAAEEELRALKEQISDASPIPEGWTVEREHGLIVVSDSCGNTTLTPTVNGVESDNNYGWHFFDALLRARGE